MDIFKIEKEKIFVFTNELEVNKIVFKTLIN